MAAYFLGVDAGSSKTHAVIAAADGRVLGVGSGGMGNWEGPGLEAARSAWATAIDAALADAGLPRDQIVGAGYGLAGYDFPSDDPRLRPQVESLEVPGPFFLDNDAFIALRAGTDRSYGVVCIAGSGSTKAGRNRQGQTFRTWGMGDEFGDWGGGGDICRAAIGAAARADKGIDPPTILTAALLDYFQLPDVVALVERCQRDYDRRIDFAHLVFEAAAAGDEPAQAILKRSAQALARGTIAVIRRLGMTAERFDLVLAGGIFRAAYPLLRDSLVAQVREVAPLVEVVRLTAPPVVGAVLLGMEAVGYTPDASLRQRLIREAEARLYHQPAG